MRFRKWQSVLVAVLLLLLFAPLALAQPAGSNPAEENAAGTGAAVCASAFGCGAGFLALVVAVLVIASLWVIFTKAGKPGWAAIVPIYNIVVLLEIIDKPIWWILLCLIPCVNVVVAFILAIELAKKFGKDALYGVGLVLLPFVFYPMLAFGKAQYVGHSAPPDSY